jgi:hypothetical protein
MVWGGHSCPPPLTWTLGIVEAGVFGRRLEFGGIGGIIGNSKGKLDMARISQETLKRLDGKASLVPLQVIVVRVASFTFRFETVKQLRECIAYYQKKTRPSSRISAKAIAADIGQDWRKWRGWEVERWFERLPMYLLEEPKRQKVLKALSEALDLVENEKL